MGLDENLPIFVHATSPEGTKHHAAIYHTISGDEPELVYVVKHADPALDHSQNCYAAALFDAYTPDILYGEVLLRPEWTQPTLSKEEQRRTGAIPPPPEPVMPTEFTIQLYNPEQQIVVSQKSGGLVGSPRWEFSVPQDVFRAPSGSILDRTQNDPGATTSTPRIAFAWKRDNKITNTLTCVMTGRSTDVVSKKRGKEPDITIGVYKSLRELTIYEPNLSRVDLQDLKGLEIILLLSSTVIRDVFFTQMKNPFNLTDAGRRRSSSTTTQASNGPPKTTTSPPPPALPPRHGQSSLPAAASGLYAAPPSRKDATTPSKYHQSPPPHNVTNPNAPITDPRTQWEIDTETARLKAQADAEAREQKRREEAHRKEQKRLADEETKRLKKIVEAEEKERLRKQKEVEKETARLKKKYGPQQMPPPPAQAKPQQPQQQQQYYTQLPQQHPPPNGRPTMTPAVGSHATQYQSQPQYHQYYNQPAPQQQQQQQRPPQIVVPPGGYNYNPQYQQQVPQHFMPPPSNTTTTTTLQQPKPQHGRRRSFLDLRNFTTLNNRSADNVSSSNNRTSNIW